MGAKEVVDLRRSPASTEPPTTFPVARSAAMKRRRPLQVLCLSILFCLTAAHGGSGANSRLLRVNCRVGEVEISACLDTGAQCCVISERCAMQCGLLPLLDRRFEGRAVGVGSAKILGRVAQVSLVLGDDQFGLEADLIVLEGETLGDGADVLLGLDVLEKYGCELNLRDHTLRLRDVIVPFADRPRTCAGPSTPSLSTTTEEIDRTPLEMAHERLREGFEGRRSAVHRLSALERSERAPLPPRQREWTTANFGRGFAEQPVENVDVTEKSASVPTPSSAGIDSIDWWGAGEAEREIADDAKQEDVSMVGF